MDDIGPLGHSAKLTKWETQKEPQPPSLQTPRRSNKKRKISKNETDVTKTDNQEVHDTPLKQATPHASAISNKLKTNDEILTERKKEALQYIETNVYQDTDDILKIACPRTDEALDLAEKIINFIDKVFGEFRKSTNNFVDITAGIVRSIENLTCFPHSLTTRLQKKKQEEKNKLLIRETLELYNGFSKWLTTGGNLSSKEQQINMKEKREKQMYKKIDGLITFISLYIQFALEKCHITNNIQNSFQSITVLRKYNTKPEGSDDDTRIDIGLASTDISRIIYPAPNIVPKELHYSDIFAIIEAKDGIEKKDVKDAFSQIL
ncbi:hypothetical protein H4219_006047, partial [Mycoemilia scoparia]